MILWTAILYDYVQGREHWTVNPLNPPCLWPGGLSELNTLISAAILYRRRHFVVIKIASKLMLQLTTEGLDLRKKSDVITEIFTEITKLVTVSDITGVQLIPKRWPHRVEILCANEKSKDILQETGLNIQNKFFELSEPGQGRIKVTIDDAPLDLSNSVLKDILNDCGNVLRCRCAKWLPICWRQ